jgi:hypothetical protein
MLEIDPLLLMMLFAAYRNVRNCRMWSCLLVVEGWNRGSSETLVRSLVLQKVPVHKSTKFLSHERDFWGKDRIELLFRG